MTARVGDEAPGRWFRIGRRLLDLETGGFDGGQLRPLELEVLRYLIRHAGRTIDVDELLREVWNYDPKVRSRTVFSTVHRLRRAIEEDPARPRHVVSVPGGYRWLVGSEPSAIPRHPGPTFGREADIARIVAALEGGVCCTVTGSPGIGKTRTVLEVAHRVAGSVSGGGWYVNLDPLRTDEDLRAAVSDTIGVSAESDEALCATLHSLGPSVVVLDEAEGCIDAVGRLVARWLAAAPELRVLVGLRVATGVRREIRFTLDPLAAEDARALVLDRLGPGAPDDSELGPLVEALEGVPLALELAARRLRSVPARVLLDRIADLRLLSGGAADGPPRHSSLEAALAVSWAHLGPEARSAWVRAAVFPAPFGLAAGEHVIGASGVEWLSALVDAHLVRFDPTAELYAMPAAIRAFVAQPDREERALAERRHGEHYASTFGAPDRPADAVELIRARPHLLVAWSRAMDRADHGVAEGAAHALAKTQGNCDIQQVLEILERTLALPELAAPGHLWAVAGHLLSVSGRMEEGSRAADQAVELLGRAPEDRAAWLKALGGRASVWALMGRMDDALASCREALAEAGPARGRMSVMLQLAGLLGRTDRIAEAIEMLEDVRGQLGDRTEVRIRLWIGHELGAWLLDAGRARQGRGEADRALAQSVRSGAVDMEAKLRYLAACYDTLVDADLSSARLNLVTGIAIDRRLGNRGSEWFGRFLLGQVELAEGRCEAAREHGTWVMQWGRASGWADAEHFGRLLLGDVDLVEGRLDDAEAHARRVVTGGRTSSRGVAERQLAEASRRRGDLEAALGWVDAGLTAAGADGAGLSPPVLPLAELILERAEILHAAGRHQEAHHHLVRVSERIEELRGDLHGRRCALQARVLREMGRDPAEALSAAEAVLGARTGGALYQAVVTSRSG